MAAVRVVDLSRAGVMDGLGGTDSSCGLLFVLVPAYRCVCWFGDFGAGVDLCDGSCTRII